MIVNATIRSTQCGVNIIHLHRNYINRERKYKLVAVNNSIYMSQKLIVFYYLNKIEKELSYQPMLSLL